MMDLYWSNALVAERVHPNDPLILHSPGSMADQTTTRSQRLTVHRLMACLVFVNGNILNHYNSSTTTIINE